MNRQSTAWRCTAAAAPRWTCIGVLSLAAAVGMGVGCNRNPPEHHTPHAGYDAATAMSAASAARLAILSNALHTYANAHGGAGPADLQALVQSGHASAADIDCPRTGFHYVYEGYRTSQAPTDIVIYERPDDSARSRSEGINTLSAAGTVEKVTGTEAEQLLAKLQK